MSANLSNPRMPTINQPAGRALTVDEWTSIHTRPIGRRSSPENLPRPGDRVGYRHRDGGVVVPARVESIDDLTQPPAWGPGLDLDPYTQPDPNVWDVVVDIRTRVPVPRADGRPGYEYTLRLDPWPTLMIVVGPAPGDPLHPKAQRLRTPTREARTPSSAGWLPASEINAEEW